MTMNPPLDALLIVRSTTVNFADQLGERCVPMISVHMPMSVNCPSTSAKLMKILNSLMSPSNTKGSAKVKEPLMFFCEIENSILCDL